MTRLSYFHPAHDCWALVGEVEDFYQEMYTIEGREIPADSITFLTSKTNRQAYQDLLLIRKARGSANLSISYNDGEDVFFDAQIVRLTAKGSKARIELRLTGEITPKPQSRNAPQSTDQPQSPTPGAPSSGR